MKGAAYDAANICAECGGPLRTKEGHYHTQSGNGYYGAEPVCCKCVPDSICKDKPVAHDYWNALGLSYGKAKGSKEGGASGSRSGNWNDDEEYMEEEVSKTSQANAKVAKAMKGKAEAKAKASKNGAAPKARAPKAEYNYRPIPASYKGNVHKVQTNGKVVSPVHEVESGKTLCGYSTTEQSKGDRHYDLQFVETKESVNCKRCTDAKDKPAKEAKASAKVTPISKAKGKGKSKK